MITTLKKLTGNAKELDKTQIRKIRGGGCYCAWHCDYHCGDKEGSMGRLYGGAQGIIEPIE
ncbi:MAG: hypothetical protein L0Y73_05540 [Candidatus Aminicenantes bacterium]|nr:hypothetical protein [Candidatus Aminicenantes bacterium]